MSLTKRLYEQQPTAADRLESARVRVRAALLAADEGDVSIETLDLIARSLVAAQSDLSTLAVEIEALTHNQRRIK